MLKNTALIALLLCVNITLAAENDDSSTLAQTGVFSNRPHESARSPNLLKNPELVGTQFWQLSGGAKHDSKASSDKDGSGSIQLVTPVPRGSVVRSDLVPVKGNTQYTFSFLMKTRNGPTYVGAQVGLYDDDGVFIRNLPSSRGATTADDLWQEFVWPVDMPADASFVRVEAYKQENTGASGTAWVDALYFGEGLVFRKPPEQKKAFNGGHVRVDELGNFEIMREEKWQPFFPLAIHSSNHRDWSVYSRQGWNTIIWTSSAEEVEKARKAVSPFNPDGMMAGVMLGQYTHPNGRLYNQLDQLKAHVESLYEGGLQEQLLFYYWDNENHHEQWQVVNDVINTIRTTEKSMAGSAQIPVYALQGSVNVARLHAYHGLVDVSGTYYNYLEARGARDVVTRHAVATPVALLDQLQAQTSPAAIAQLNDVQGEGDFRLRAYNAINAGAKGIGYWRDCISEDCQAEFPDVGPVDEKRWSADLPLLRQEFDQLLPIIRAPHWTDWQVAVTPADHVHVGTRDHEGQRVLIVVNQTTSRQQISVSFSGDGKDAVQVRDFFTGQAETKVSGKGIDLLIEGIGVGSGTRVLLVD